MKRKNIITSLLLIVVVAVSGLLVTAGTEKSTSLFTSAEELEPGCWRIHFLYTSENNVPPEFIYFMLWDKGAKKYYPATYPEVKDNWNAYKDKFVAETPDDTDYTDGKWYYYDELFCLGTTGVNMMHAYASDGTTVVRYPTDDNFEQVFGYVKYMTTGGAVGPTAGTPYPYPYPG
ncbi:MAG: hypothetical protein ACXQTP_05130 [Candidatus Methanofastidiosia archaeon]